MRHRRCASTLAALAVVALTAACGAGGSAEAPPAGGGACDGADPIRFGALAPLTGPSADLGEQTRDGLEVAVEDVNTGGGVLGRCVELLLEDDAGDPTTATQAARELVDQEEVAAVIGPVLSSPTGAALEVTSRVPVPHFVLSALPAAGDPATYPHAFMNEFTSAQIVETNIAYLQRAGYTRPAVLAVNNALGTVLTDAFVAQVGGAGAQLAADPVLHESGAADLTPQLRSLTAAQPDVLVVFSAAGPDLAAAVRARNQLAPQLPVVGIGAMANVSATGALAPEEMQGVVAGPFMQNFTYREGEDTATTERAQAFLERLREFTGVPVLEESASQVASAYDAVNIAAGAIEGAGSADAEAVRTYLETTPYEGVRGQYSWSPESHVGTPLELSAFVLAGSLDDGILQLAPGEGEQAG